MTQHNSNTGNIVLIPPHPQVYQAALKLNKSHDNYNHVRQ